MSGLPGSSLAMLRYLPGAAWRLARRGRLGHAIRIAWRTLRYKGTAGMAHEVSMHLAQDAPYSGWIARHDTLGAPDRDRLAARLGRMGHQPLISLLMPVYNSPERWLRDAVASVQGQIYANWQLCIADDASTAPHIPPLLESLSRADARIRVCRLENNSHISAASNTALAMADGEFIGLLDHDDLLAPHALALMALEIDQHPDADLIYSDEDKVDLEGRRFGAYFKPDWSPDLMRCQNMVSHFGVYRTALARQVGGFRVGYEGSQDWDLALRVADASATDRIRHLPFVLYHWRTVPGSTATGIAAKSYAVDAGRQAVSDHLERAGIAACVAPLANGHLYVDYALPSPPPGVSLIVPIRSERDRQALEQHLPGWIARAGMPVAEVVAAGDASIVSHLAAPRTDAVPGRVIAESVPDHARCLEAGARRASGQVLAFLSPLLRADSDNWLRELVAHALRPTTGAAGACLMSFGTDEPAGGYVLGLKRQGRPSAHIMNDLGRLPARTLYCQNLSAIDGDCLVIRRDALDAIGGWRSEHAPFRWADVDLSLRLRQSGLWNVWLPQVRFTYAAKPDRPEPSDEELEGLAARWLHWFAADPAYNTNLDLDWPLPIPGHPRHARPWADDADIPA